MTRNARTLNYQIVDSSFIVQPSSFVIRTPTATVTDLGTEFGVEVNKEGATDTHVFIGEVQIATGSGQGLPGGKHESSRPANPHVWDTNEAISVGERRRRGECQAVRPRHADSATVAHRR